MLSCFKDILTIFYKEYKLLWMMVYDVVSILSTVYMYILEIYKVLYNSYL